jgi:WD40 repeat protein
MRMLTVRGGSRARLWSLETGRLLPFGDLKRESVYAVAVSPDGKTALTGGLDGATRLRDLPAMTPRGEPLAEAGAAHLVEFSPDGKRAATVASNVIRIWDTATWKILNPAWTQPDPIYAIWFTADNRHLVTVDTKTFFRLWDLERGQTGPGLALKPGKICDPVVLPDGRVAVLAVSGDATATVWDCATGKPVGEVLRHPTKLMNVAITRDGRTAATGAARLFACGTRSPAGRAGPRSRSRDRSATWLSTPVRA